MLIHDVLVDMNNIELTCQNITNTRKKIAIN